MEKKLGLKPAELKGEISLTLANDQSLDDFCEEHIMDYNREQFKAFAIRVFVGRETIITIYATDKDRLKNEPVTAGKIPVKKFKISTLPVSVLFSYCEGFNCTVLTGEFDLNEMEVTI